MDEKKKALIVFGLSLTTVMLAAGSLIFRYWGLINSFIYQNQKNLLDALSLLIIGLALAYLLVKYVNYTGTNPLNSVLFNLFKIDTIQQLHEEKKRAALLKLELAELENDFAKMSQIKEPSPADLENFLKPIELTAAETPKTELIFLEFSKIRDRLEKESNKISRLGNLNLVIGFATTILAIYVLYETLLPTTLIGTEYITHLVPRVSLGILIELFAFFFLKMYRNNISDIKYYNNEKTNIDFKLLALRTAIVHETHIEETIAEFLKSERNFILKKGESTVELQKATIESNSSQKIIDSLTGLLKSK